VGTDHDRGAGVMRGARRGCNRRPPEGRRSRRRRAGQRLAASRPERDLGVREFGANRQGRDRASRPEHLSGLAQGAGRPPAATGSRCRHCHL